MTKLTSKYKSDINTSIFLSLIMGMGSVSMLNAQEKPNILFIAVDDMNCDFGAYGNPVVKSPNLDALAAEGVLFANNHCQKAVSGASRASLLSGFTPEHTGITGFYLYLRDLYPDVVTLPQFFKNNGYHTAGMGKIHDPRNVSLTDKVDLVSWSEFIDIDGNKYVTSSGNPVTEAADVDDDGYTDGRIADEGVRQIASLSVGTDPFFIAVGFKKPHLPFTAPKKYWDLYDRDSISLAPFQKFAENDLEFVHNPGDEFYNGYDNVPENGEYSADLQREYIHGYYACVSYIDAQIGKLINELKFQGVYDNTIIIMWGDHGFSLGDHTNWGKHTNFEYATRSPLIIKAPGKQQDKVIQSPSELLDIYPTLVDLAGFEIPDTLDGNSLVPILNGTTDHVKAFAISQFKRGGKQGFSLRSDYFQYVEWRNDDNISHIQLFDFVNDPFQTNNLYNVPDGAELVDTFSIRLNNYLETGENSSPVNLISNTDSLGLYRNYHKVEFVIYEDYNKVISPFKDVQISVDMLKLPTSNKGYAALQLQPGNYSYVLNKENYSSIAGNFQLSGDTVIIDTLKREFVDVSINVVNDLTGENISLATVAIDEKTQETNIGGNVTFSVHPGDYEVLVNHNNYKSHHSDMSFYIDTSYTLRLKPSFATIKFRLKDGDTPVNNAEIHLNDSSQITNSLGLAYFYDLAVDSTYEYSIQSEGYKDESGTILLNIDTTLNIELVSTTNIQSEEYSSCLIYPNPAGNEINISSLFPVSSVTVTGICGKTIFSECYSQEMNINMDISSIEKGMYLITTKSQTQNRKFHRILIKQ
ncbi:MAG: sulfatase-like hydrolase/transferase [Bacteroidales bacterium]|nr:sulfatase-like hydrolase/transferase [Bacteroidales bacterium]